MIERCGGDTVEEENEKNRMICIRVLQVIRFNSLTTNHSKLRHINAVIDQ